MANLSSIRARNSFYSNFSSAGWLEFRKENPVSDWLKEIVNTSAEIDAGEVSLSVMSN